MRHGKLPAFRLAFFGMQFFCILLVCLNDLFSIFSESATFFPKSFQKFWGDAAEIASVPLGQTLPEANPVRQGVITYLHLGGIQAGYTYFAPTIPDNYKIVFELHYPDGRTEIELPQVNSRATGLRFATLLDRMTETEYEPLRTLMVKMLTYSVWREHPEVRRIRTVLGYVDLPTPAEFRGGGEESYHVLSAYDFDFSEAQPSQP